MVRLPRQRQSAKKKWGHVPLGDISMATQWVPSPVHSKGKIRVFLLQEVLFVRAVHSVGVSKYGHQAEQAQESLLDSGATNKAFFILGR